MSVAATWLPAPFGSVINGEYRLDDVIGEGGMGVVIGGVRISDGMPVALKFVKPDLADDERSARRLWREAHMAAQLTSPHAVRVMDIGETTQGSPFIVMERLNGETVDQWLQGGVFAVEDACLLLADVCSVLAEAHARGLVHRDITPRNLVLTRGSSGPPHIKVLDFGLTKAVNDEPSADVTHQHQLVGSPPYMSPEQVAQRRLDKRSDIWSMGVVLQQMVTGQLPFAGPSPADTLAAIVTQPPAPLVRANAPARLFDVVARCLRKHPDERYPTADALREDLLRTADDVTQSEPPSSDEDAPEDETIDVPLHRLPWHR